MNSGKLLLFGASGSIGRALRDKFLAEGWQIVAVARHKPEEAKGVTTLEVDPFETKFDGSVLDAYAPFTAVCWAQGANLNDSVYDVTLDRHIDLYRANCLYILATLRPLLTRRHLGPGSKLTIISSIWQNIARQNKLSYGMTKAALQGLVLSAAADLAADGHMINAVLPGALDTPMTRQNLNVAQIEELSSATKFNRLPALQDVANMVYYLSSPQNTGITGQFIAADLGFSHVRLL